MNNQLPFVLLEQPYMIMEETATFCVRCFQMSPMHVICLDIYSVRDSRFLNHHLARFQYSPNFVEQGCLQFSFQRRPMALNVDGAALLGFALYVNNDEGISYPMEIRIAILSKDDSTVIFEDYLRIYAITAEFDQDRNYFNKWIETYPMLDTPSKGQDTAMPIICLISASFRDFDAVGNFVWDGWSLLTRNGFCAEIYSQYCDLHFRPFTRNVKELFSETTDELAKRVFFYTYSIYDEHLPDIAGLPCKKIAYYHGITDPNQVGDIDDHVKKMCQAGLKDLSRLSVFDGLLANSQSTLREFRQHYHSTAQRSKFSAATTLPPFVSLQSKWAVVETDDSATKEWALGEKVLLYVGRMFPHKHVEDVIAVFAEYHKNDPLAQLVLVGGQHPTYFAFLQHEIGKLSQSCQQQIRFLATLSQGQLKSVYKAASVFITMTEHEGFCIPVLEAMLFGIPVIAKNEAAVPEVLDGSGIVIDSFNPTTVANIIHRICYDLAYRQDIVRGQSQRAAEFDDQSLAKNYLAVMQKYFGGPEK